jgi:hypothetical protein
MQVFLMQIARRGLEVHVVTPGSRALSPLTDRALFNAIAMVRECSDDLFTGRAKSVTAITGREVLVLNYVRLTRLAFLTPRIIEAMAVGHDAMKPYCEDSARTDRSSVPHSVRRNKRSESAS